MKLSTILFLSLFITPIVCPRNSKNVKGAGGRGSYQRDNNPTDEQQHQEPSNAATGLNNLAVGTSSVIPSPQGMMINFASPGNQQPLEGWQQQPYVSGIIK